MIVFKGFNPSMLYLILKQIIMNSSEYYTDNHKLGIKYERLC